MRALRARAERSPGTLVEACAAAGVRDERVLDAFRRVPRASFVPEEHVDRAYEDVPIAIPHDQVTTQPSLIAKMVEALELRGGEKVLEIGTGHGFQTALLARLARFVWSIERWPGIADVARGNLAREGVRNAEVIAGDGSMGLPAHAPFDAIVVSAAFPKVVEPLAAQLADRGRLVQPVGPGGAEDVAQFVNTRGRLERVRSVTGAYFVRLYGEHGFAP